MMKKKLYIFLSCLTVILSCKDNHSDTMSTHSREESFHDKIVFDTIANIEINDQQVIKYLNSDTFNCSKFERDSLSTNITLYVRGEVLENDSLKILLLNNKIFPIISDSIFSNPINKTNDPIITITGGGAKITLNKKDEVIRFIKYQ